MRYLTLLLCLSPTLIAAQNTSCTRTASFGDVSICLPLVKGMQECYEDPTVKLIADATEMPTNEVLGYYLTVADYAALDSMVNEGFADYFKVYGVTEISRVPVGTAELTMMYDILTQQLGDTISGVNKMVNSAEEQLDDLVKIGIPQVQERYQLTDDSFTFVTLITYSAEGDSTITMAMTINGTILQDRLVWMAYYNRYVDDSTIELLKKRSDAVLQQLITDNK